MLRAGTGIFLVTEDGQHLVTCLLAVSSSDLFMPLFSLFFFKWDCGSSVFWMESLVRYIIENSFSSLWLDSS